MRKLRDEYSTKQSIRIFVAASPAEALPLRVLEFSIRETTRQPVEIAAIDQFGRTIPTPQAIENRPRTPFSFQRFLIPELCNFAGKAIYLDADMQVFSDIAELWDQDFKGCDLQTVQTSAEGRRGQFSVMLLDCARLDWRIEQIVADLDAGKLDYAALMFDMRVANKIGRDIAPAWNSLEHYDPTSTRLLHYTDMNTQPWIAASNPLGQLWIACLRRAIVAQFITREEIIQEITAGHVRPSLLAQLDAGIDDSLLLPSAIRKLDRNFMAPYRHLQSGSTRPWTTVGFAVRAFLRRHYYQSTIARLFR
jgi:glycosyl transferase family 8